MQVDIKLSKEIILITGQHHQIDICQEECAELIDALSKYKRHRVPKEKVCEEIADMYICLQQMLEIFNPRQDIVQQVINEKQSRLRKRIQDGRDL